MVGCESLSSSSNQHEIKLFNGDNLDGLYTYLRDTQFIDPRNVFSVKDQILHISGDGYGYIGTQDVYQDYELTLEYRWGNFNHNTRKGKARDAGLFIHATGMDGGSYDGEGAYMAAIECQIMEGATGDMMLIRGKDQQGKNLPMEMSAIVTGKKDKDGFYWFGLTGEEKTINTYGRFNWRHKSDKWVDVYGFRAKMDLEKLYTGFMDPNLKPWNELKVISREGKIRVVLNGILVNEVFNVEPRHGKILLQCEGSSWQVRKMVLRLIK